MTTNRNTGQNPAPGGLPYNTATSTTSARQTNSSASPGTTPPGASSTASGSAGTASGQQNTTSAQAPTTRQVGQNGQSAQIIGALTALGYSFRMNDLIGDVEMNGELLTDGQ